MPFFTNAYKVPALQLLISSGGLSGTCQVGLFTNNIVVDGTTLLSALVEATYATYSRQNLTFGAAFAAGTGGESDGTTALFSPGVLPFPQDCYGWFLLDNVGNLIGLDTFAGGPLNMGGTIPAVGITPSVVYA